MTICLKTTELAVPHRLKPLSLEIRRGEFVGLIGPNGAGKTSFLRAALGLLAAQGNSNLARLPLRQRPRHAAYLAQERDLVWPISCQDLVALGYRAHPDHRGEGLVETRQILQLLQLTDFAHRAVNQLSGGEKARVLLARALAQNAPLLIADEPCAALDPAHAQTIAKLLQAQALAGKSVLASLHDLALAARWCSRILVLKEGALIADGPPDQVMTKQLMAEVFGISFERFEGAEGPLWAVGERISVT